ncbi:hypothetical protein AB1Y20_006328 [Prymnesium parvum]|uniref:Uncharacterized protein n=1 Tax=Prymnesium parvum TaxID=97485 RepID=A0AB34J1Y4_PRYPA
MCVRGTVYALAEENLAFHSKEKYIWYEDEDLKLELIFKSEERAMLFETNINLWNTKCPLGFEIAAPTVELTHETGVMQQLPRVRLASYKPEDTDLPFASLANLQGARSAPASFIELSDDLAKYQSFEDPIWLRAGRSKPYRLHLKNKGPSYGHDPALAKDENNMVAGSWEFHQFLDGLDMESNMPVIALRPDGVGNEIEENGRKRRKVTVSIECHNEEIAAIMNFRLKAGSKKLDSLTYSTDVYVTHPHIFNECLQWKYDQTKKQWQDINDILNEL